MLPGTFVNKVEKCSMPQAQLLRSRLEKPGVILLPGVFDCIGAMLCEKLGFDAIYTSGFSIAGSALGMPDIGLLTASENVEIIGRIANSVNIPVVADCDTGYGGPMNVYRLVTDLARQNVAAICLEDQQWPKKCGMLAFANSGSCLTIRQVILKESGWSASKNMLLRSRLRVKLEVTVAWSSSQELTPVLCLA